MLLELECGVGLHLLRHVTPLKRRDLFLLRRSYAGKKTFRLVAGKNGDIEKGRRSTHHRHQALTAIQQIAANHRLTGKNHVAE
jgi:hypothetical protein